MHRRDPVGQALRHRDNCLDPKVIVGIAMPQAASAIIQNLSLAFPQDRTHGTQKPGPHLLTGFFHQGLDAADALFLFRLGHLLRIRGGCRSRARTVGKDMRVGKPHFPDEVQAFLKGLFRFPWKTCDDIRRQHKIRNRLACLRHQVPETGYCTAACHAAQNGIRPRLQRQMQVRTQSLWPFLPQRKEAIPNIPGFQAAEPQPRYIRFRQDLADQRRQVQRSAVR